MDLNKDGRDEEISVDISVAGLNPADVKQVFVMQSFSYGLSETVTIDFKLPVYNVF